MAADSTPLIRVVDQKKIPRIPEFQYSERIGIGGTDGQLGAKVNGGRPKETPFRMPELQSSRSTGVGGTGGQLGARIKSGRSKETPAIIPEPQYGRPIGYEGTGGQLGAKVKSGRPQESHARRPELQSSSSRVQNESSSMNTKGPVAGKRDAPQAPTGFRVTRDQASNVEYLEELDSGDDK